MAPAIGRLEARDEAVVPRLLRRSDAARYLGVSVAQLDVLRALGEIVPVAMPGRTGEPVRVPLYDRVALDAAVTRWAEAGRG